ncbi:MAG: MerR family transcriptional regulator [Anaerolineae bacterium]|nr:MerR family transcriptional regulator [Anaerolineae bacterium]
MNRLSIGDVAKLADVRASTLRFYESIGLIAPDRRVSGRRYYTPDVLHRLALIKLAQRAGFTLAEIGVLFNDFAEDTPASERWTVLAQQKMPEVEQAIARANEMKHVLERMMTCRCDDLSECVA